MSKISLTNLVNLQNETTAVNAINANNAVLTTALDNTLSRDGTSPNTMSAVLDMNNNQIINLPAPSTVNSPARLVDVTSNPTIVVPGTGTSGHTVPFLDGNNTWSGTNQLSSVHVTGTSALDGAVTFGSTVNLPAGTVANSQLANMPNNTIKGNVSGISAAPANLTATQLTTLVNPVTASLPGAITAYPNDTSKFFRGDGTYAVPPTAARVLLNTLTANASVTLSDTTSFTSTYSMYEIMFQNIIPATGGQLFELQVHSSGAFQTTGYLAMGQVSANGGTFSGAAFTGAIVLGSSLQTNAAPGISGLIRVFTPTGTTAPKQWSGTLAGNTSTPSALLFITNGYWNASTAVDGFQLLFGSGNITSGTVKIYGII